MRRLAVSLVFVCAASFDAAADTGPGPGPIAERTAGDAGVAQPETSPQPPPPSATPEFVPPPAPLRMVSEVPRWPFIAGAFVVFLIMAAFGLRRRA